MKKSKTYYLPFQLLPLFLMIQLSVPQQALSQKDSGNQVIKITGTRLTFPIFQRWSEEYTKLHPQIKILVKSGIPSASADILIVSHHLGSTDVKEGQAAIAITRYLQLPIINSQRDNVSTLQSDGFTEDELKKVYFQGNSDDYILPPEYHFVVYKREKPACASIALANHFGQQQVDIKGVGIEGDDQDLLEAVKKDVKAISYNNLGFIYDIQTRKVVDGIAIIPIDFNENGKIDEDEKIYSTLDLVLQYAEKTNNPKLFLENVNVIVQKNSRKEVIDFLQWVLKYGQRYNHAYGFLNLDKKQIASEKEFLSNIHSANSGNSSKSISTNYHVSND
ncbi:MAG: hypothetical protein C5B59_00300 [Bacteroidetes bacterium]|nr:MAG: hypothetical protein C5B59_00300 [Bacteroidota bacterium]